MSYNAKNYTEQGGDKTVIGGTLEILEGATVKGLPHTSNIANSSATTVATLKDDFNGLLAKLKDAGYITKDTFTATSVLAPSPTDANLIANHAKVTSVSIANDVVTIVAPLSELTAYASSDPTQGTHKWVGLSIGTGCASIIGIKYGDYAFTNADVTEATSVGCPAGSFILYIKCDEVVSTDKVFTLSKEGYETKTITVKFQDNGN